MRIGRKIWLILILLFGVTLPLSTAFAAGNQYIYESNWAITVDFVEDTPNAVLVVEVWQYEQDTLDLVDHMVTSHMLSCHVPSSVLVKDSVATFSGGPGIRCELPSLAKIVSEMTVGAYQLPDACACKTGAIVQADTRLMANKSGPDRQNPIATLSSIALAAPIPAKTGLRTNLEMTVDGVTAVSKPFPAQSFFQLYEGSFDEINPYPSPTYNYFNHFEVDGAYQVAIPNFINQPLLISNTEPALYIGYDPGTGEGLYGEIGDLFVDPGCFGGGGY